MLTSLTRSSSPFFDASALFPAAPPHLRVLVALEVDLLLPQRLQQRDQHEPVVQALLNVVDDVCAIQLDVRPFRERLVRENPVLSVALG